MARRAAGHRRGVCLQWLAVAAALAVVGSMLPVLTAAQDTLMWSEVSSRTAPSPPRRRSFAAGFDIVDNRIVIFGGKGNFDDTWFFDIPSGTWTELTTSTLTPPARFEFVGGVHNPTRRFYISTGEGRGDVFFNDVWYLDLATEQWVKPAATGSIPDVRYGGGGGFDPWDSSRFFIVSHGFKRDPNKRFDDTFAYDVSTDTWFDVTPDDGRIPFARCLVAGAVRKGDLYTMYGGCGSGGHGPCPAADAWALNGDPALGDEHVQWDKQKSCISPRLYSRMAVAPGGAGNGQTVAVFGGKSFWGEGEDGEVGMWNVVADSWVRYKVKGPNGVPSKRYGHEMVTGIADPTTPDGRDVVYVIGGSGAPYMDVWMLSGNSTAGVETLDCPFVFNIRLLHGLLMFFSWGLLLPIGVTIARFGKELSFVGPATWFKLHRGLNMAGWFIQILGFVAAMFVNEVGKFSAIPHVILGPIAFLLGTQQPINAFFRPHPPENKTCRRKCWEFWHLYSGRVATFCGVLNCFWGIAYLDTRYRTQGPAFILYSIWVAVLVVFWVVMTFRGLPHQSWPNPSPLAHFLSTKMPCIKREDPAKKSAPPAAAAATATPVTVGPSSSQPGDVEMVDQPATHS